MAAEQKEIIALTAEDHTKPAVTSANKNIESVEKAADKAADAITQTTKAAGQSTISIAESSKKSIERIVAQAERDANRVSMTRVEQMTADRDRKLKMLGGDVEAINRFTVATNRTIAHAIEAEKQKERASEGAAAASSKAAAAATREAAANEKVAASARHAAVETTAATSATVKATAALDRHTTGLDRFASRAKSVQSIASSLGQSLTIGITTPLALASKEAVDVAARFDAIDKSIGTILGSSALSKLVQRDLREASRVPGQSLTFEGAAGGFRRIAAARRDIQLATDAVKEFGNALALAGGTEEDLQGVTLALTQILSKAKVSAEEINQIAERIPSTRRLIQQAFGTADSEAIVKKGISPEDFVRGVVEQAKLLPRATATIQSEMKNIREDFREALAIAGRDLAEVLLPILKSGSAALRSFVEGFSELSPAIRKVIVTATLAAGILGPLLLTLGGFARVATTVAQGMALIQAAQTRATASAVTNTAAVVAETKAYDALAVSAGRAAAVQAIPGRLPFPSALAARQAQLAQVQAAGAARAAELAAIPGIAAGARGTLVTEQTAATAAKITAQIEALKRVAAPATKVMLDFSGALNAARLAGAAFLSIPLIGTLQGWAKAFINVGDSAKTALVFDKVTGGGGVRQGGLLTTLSAAARNLADLSGALAKDIFGPSIRGFQAWGTAFGTVIGMMKTSYNDFVDMVSRSQFARKLVKPFQDLIDAGRNQLGIERELVTAQKRFQNLMAKGAHDAAVAAGGFKPRGEADAKYTAEAEALAKRRMELTRDLRMELTKSTTEAQRAAKEISEVERIAADRAQERLNLIEKEGAAFGKLQRRLFDLATTQKLLEADRKNTTAAMKEATQFRDNAIERELTGLQKIAEQRRQAVAALDQRKLSAADRAKAMGLIDEGTVALTGKYMDQLLKEATDFFNQSAKIAGEGYDRLEEQRTQWLEKVKDSPAAIAQVNAAILELEQRLTRDLERELAERQADRELRGIDAQRDTYLRQLELQKARALDIETTFGKENLARQIQYEQDRLAVEKDFGDRRLAAEIATIERKRDAAIAAAETDKQRDAIRRRAEEDTADARQKRQIDIDAQRQQTSIRIEEMIRQQNQKTFDAFKRGYDDVFDALVLRTKSFGDVMKNILKAALLTPIKEATGNVFAGAMTQIFGIPQPGTAGVQSKLELPNRLGDVQLQGGAVPVVIEGATPAAARQIQAPATNVWQKMSGLGGLFGGMGALGRVGATPPFVPGGSVSSTINYGGGAIPLGGTTYPGTPPFVPGGSGGGGFGDMSGLGGLWGNLKQSLGKLGSIGGARGVGGIGGGLMLLGGGILAANGLRQGGWAGFGQTVAGGAILGAKFGGPMGALIGAGIGAAAGGIRMLFKGKDEQIVSKVKSIYGVTIDSKFAKDPLGVIIQQKYGGNLDVGIRSPEVRDLVNLYGRATGQNYGIANKAFGVGLEQTGGVLTQYAARTDGLNVAYAGGTLGLSGPVDRLVTSTVGDSIGMAQTIEVKSLQLLVNGQSAANALAAGVVENPAAVAQASLLANRRGVNRRENLVLQQSPGLLMA